MRKSRILAAVLAGVLVLGGAAACAETAPPDEIGLYYMVGPSDGHHFGHCILPGQSDDPLWNNEVVRLPASVRTWNIAPSGGDSTTPITANSRPEEGQPSGVQMNLWPQITLTLDTDCGDNNADASSPVVRFWESIGRRYNAQTADGWTALLNNTVVTALAASARSVVRNYTADDLVAGVVREEVQAAISDLFQREIVRVSGGRFFCSPYYDPRSSDPERRDCGEVQILLTDIDYANPAIQQARDERQAAIERATALVAEAEGRLAAAEAEEQLYTNEAWMELEKARIQLQMVQACAANPNCTIVLGADGTIVGTR